MAAFAVPAISAATQLLGQALAAHTARLNDATNENQAVDQVIPAYDADLAAIQAAYESGTDPSQCIAALNAVDTNIFNYMYALHGKPGTAWGGPTTGALGSGINPAYDQACNKTCTAACCVYLNDLRPGIFGHASAAGVKVVKGCIECILSGGGTAQIPEVYPPSDKSYGNYARAGYSITFTKPPASQSTAAQVLSVSGVNARARVVAQAPPTINGTPTQALVTATSASAAPSLLGELSNSEIVTILGVLGGIILIITALFGQNALRVDK